jgi:serine/threonine protein kinase
MGNCSKTPARRCNEYPLPGTHTLVVGRKRLDLHQVRRTTGGGRQLLKSASPMIGTNLSHYRILEQIGEGGMGVVYRAEDDRLGRQVAVKVLAPHLASDEASRARFLVEARAASALDHRNVCVIHDIGETSTGQLFMVMPFYQGLSLRERLQAGPMPPGEAIAVASDIATGLARAHAAGIVHRDIKPGNVVLTRDGEVKILDFGIAKLNREQDITRSGMVVGTLYYLAPEQFGGGDIDARADVWALGVLLFECLTGQLPFRGHGQAETMHAILQRPPKLELVSDRAGADVAEVVRRCLAKSAEERPRDGREVAELLATLQGAPAPVTEEITLQPGPTQAFLTPQRARLTATPSVPALTTPGRSSSGLRSLGTGFGFVGRDEELGRLRRLATAVLEDGVRVALICGEAGRGKTTLVGACARELESQAGWLAVAANCSPQAEAAEPFQPFREALGRLIGEVDDDAPGRSEATKAPETLASRFLPVLLGEARGLLGTFLSPSQLAARLRSGSGADLRLLTELEAIDGRTTGEVNPALARSEIFEAYARVLSEAAKHRPLLLVLEDLHWADPGSASLLAHLSRALTGSAVLIVGTFRREELALESGGDRHPFETVANDLVLHFGDIEIDLDQGDPRAFVDALLDHEPNDIGDSFRRELVERTGGLPLFATEVLRTLRDDGFVVRREDGAWVLAGTIQWSKVPRRVEAVVAERIGRLPTGLRQVLTTAAIEGEELTAELVALVAGRPERDVVRELSTEAGRRYRIVIATGVRRLGERRLSLYRFRHSHFAKYLVDRLDPVERCVLHEEVAQGLEQLWGPRSNEIATRLAHHYLEAELPERALPFLVEAARRAARLSAHEDALRLTGRAERELRSMDLPAAESNPRLFEILTVAAPSVIATHGFASSQVEQHYLRWRELSGRLTQAPDVLVLWGLYAFSTVRGDIEPALPLARQMVERARSVGEPEHTLQAAYCLGATQLLRGDLAEAQEALDLARGMDHADTGRLCQLFAMDSRLPASVYAAMVRWLRGDEVGSRRLLADTLAQARGAEHALTTSTTLFLCGLASALWRDWDAVAAAGADMHDLIARFGLFQQPEAGVLTALAAAGRDSSPAACERLAAAIDRFRIEGSRVFLPYLLAQQGALERACAAPSEVARTLDRARTIVEATGERFWLAEIERLSALVDQAPGTSADRTRERLEAAATLARHQGAAQLATRIEAEPVG